MKMFLLAIIILTYKFYVVNSETAALVSFQFICLRNTSQCHTVELNNRK